MCSITDIGPQKKNSARVKNFSCIGRKELNKGVRVKCMN